MMKNQTRIYLILLGLCSHFLCVSCSYLTGALQTAATTAAGAYAVTERYGGDPVTSAVGAAAGYVVGEGVRYLHKREKDKAYKTGYDKGQSDAVKELYWSSRELHAQRRPLDYEVSFYEIPVPEHTRDGVRFTNTSRVISVYEKAD